MNGSSSCLKQKIKLTAFSPRRPLSKKKKKKSVYLPVFFVERFQMLELMENCLTKLAGFSAKGTPHLALLPGEWGAVGKVG